MNARHLPKPLVFALLLACAGLASAAEPPAPPAQAEPPADAAPQSAPADADAIAAEAAATAVPPAESVPLRDIQAFAAVFRAVRSSYVDKVGAERLMQDAIRGLLAGLDPHSEYLDRSMLTDLDEDTRGAYAGLGVEVLYVDGLLRVVAPIDDSPAARAGIQPGDIITRIDGVPVPPTNGQEAVDKLRGEPGSEIALTIAREGNGEPLELTLQREVIKVASVRTRTLEPGFIYLRIGQFQQHTAGEVREKLRRATARGRLRGAVLDLRSNPGGLLESAVEVSDAFLDDGVIVSTRGRLEAANGSYSATRGDVAGGAPLVVLVDAGTASAAEIVAGALKDHHRAGVMGQRTFGKGSVQSVLPLDGGDALKLTTARYYTPAGISIQAAGIEPDIELADLRLTVPDRPASVATSERTLSGHLVGDLEAQPVTIVERDESLDQDYGLNEAMNVLKGLALVRERAMRKAQPQKG
ncbi:MAG: S41 family peptidase [Pseudomonadota bacterium]